MNNALAITKAAANLAKGIKGTDGTVLALAFAALYVVRDILHDVMEHGYSFTGSINKNDGSLNVSLDPPTKSES